MSIFWSLYCTCKETTQTYVDLVHDQIWINCLSLKLPSYCHRSSWRTLIILNEHQSTLPPVFLDQTKVLWRGNRFCIVLFSMMNLGDNFLGSLRKLHVWCDSKYLKNFLSINYWLYTHSDIKTEIHKHVDVSKLQLDSNPQTCWSWVECVKLTDTIQIQHPKLPGTITASSRHYTIGNKHCHKIHIINTSPIT